jgi:hypothetical protein
MFPRGYRAADAKKVAHARLLTQSLQARLGAARTLLGLETKLLGGGNDLGEEGRMPSRGSGRVASLVGLSRPALMSLSSQRCGAKKAADAASPTCWLARSSSKSPAAFGAERMRTPWTIWFVTCPLRAASHAKASSG